MKHALRRKSAPKIKKYNQKSAIRAYQKQFKIKFDMKPDAIDLRTMSQNYPHGIIPLEDIYQSLCVMLGPNYGPSKFDCDPSGGAVIHYPSPLTKPQFKYVSWDELYLWSRFQRDVAPNHTSKIKSDFEPTCVTVPDGIKITVAGKIYYFIWDGHHTTQVMRLEGYNRFPLWYTDIDALPGATITAAGFNDNEHGRVQYGVWLAGQNMIRINSKNSRKLSSYDEFMILLETLDAKTVAMKNILDLHTCIPKRHGTCAGAFTQFKNGVKCYDLDGTGTAWGKALKFHRETWTGAAIELEVFRPMSYLYHMATTQGLYLDQTFNDEFAKILIKTYGDPEGVQLALKDSCEYAYQTNTGSGVPPADNKDRVLYGMINLYNQSGGTVRLPLAEYIWTV